MKITLIGLGKMGSQLAKRLVSSSADLTVYNRTTEKMIPLINLGAKPAKTLKEAVVDAEIIVTCLLNDEAVLAAVNEFIPFLKQDAIHIGTSTILPNTSKKLFDLHNQYKTHYIAGNVLGIPKIAEQGKLTSIVAGNPAIVEKCTWLFQTYSEKIINVGEKPYQANVIKICMNYMLAAAIETMGELYVFVEKNEINPEILNTLFHSVYAHPAFKLYVDKIKNRNFDEVNFDVLGGYKDLNLFQQAFADVKMVSDIGNIIKNKFIIALAYQMEHKDWSAVAEISRKLAHLM